jgi:hypothetical protein
MKLSPKVLSMPDLELETKLINEYVVPEKQGRYLSFISSPRLRGKFIASLAHFKDFQPGKFEDIKLPVKESIYRKLGEKKISLEHCYVISENGDIDGRAIAISEALEIIVGYGMGSIMIFGKGEVVFYEGEWKERAVSK